MSEATQRLEALVMDQFAGELELSREVGLYDNRKSSIDVPPPSDAQTAYRLLITQLTADQVFAILAIAKQPQLQMEPITSFGRVVQTLDEHKKLPRQSDTYVSSEYRAKLAWQDASAGIGNNVGGWNLGIIDAAARLDANPELRGTFGQKCAKNNELWDYYGLRSPHPRRYALAQLRAILKRGIPFLDADHFNWSALNDDTGNTSAVPGGFWSGFGVFFVEDFSDFSGDRRDRVRFRPEVVVKVA